MEPECYKYACIKLSPACLRASVWNAKMGASDCQVPSLHLDTFFTGRLANASCVKCSKLTPRSRNNHTRIPRKGQCLCLCPLGQGFRGRIKNNKQIPQHPLARLEHLGLQKDPGYHHSLGLPKHPCSLPMSGLNGIFPRTQACLLLGLALDSASLHFQNQNVQDQDVARRHSVSAVNIWAALCISLSSRQFTENPL